MQMYVKSMAFSNRMLRERMGGGGRLLDIGGAGCPFRANELADLFREVVLVDVCPPCAPLKPNARFVKVPAEELGPGLGVFEHVLMSNVLEHLPDPARALAAAARVLAPGGALHILSPNCESLNRRIGVLMGVLGTIREITPAEQAMGHVQALALADLRALIARAGLEIRECRGVFLKPVPTPDMIQWPEARIRAYFDIAAQVPPELCHELYLRVARPV